MIGSEVSAALASLKAAFDILKGMNSLNIDVSVKQQTTELLSSLIAVQSGMLSLQTEYQKLLESNEDLRQQIVQSEQWEETESHYDLRKTTLGGIVRAPNAKHPRPDPLYWLCANCFENKKKSILQKSSWGDHDPLFCPSCKIVIHLGIEERPLFRG